MSTVEFGSLFRFVRNGMNVKQDKSGAGLPITRIETIANATVDPGRVGYAGLEEDDCRDWLMEAGDILFSHINSVTHIGKCAVYRGVPEKLVHGMNLLCLRCDTTRLLPDFAKYLISASQFRTRLSNFTNKAVNQASVSIGNLRTIPVTVPPLPEQQRIATILDKADELLAKRRGALAQLDSLTESIFLGLFGDPLSNSNRWPKVELQAVTDVITGYPFRSQEYVNLGDTVKLCRGANVLPGRLDWSDLACWPKSKIEHFSEFVIASGDIVLAMDRPWIAEGFKIAQVGDEDCPALLVQRVARLRGKNGVPNEFIFSLLRQPAFTRHCRPTETTVPHISPTEIRSFEFHLPPLDLQRNFARRVVAVNKLKAAQRASLADMEALFASLQHRAFRGEL